MLQKSAKNVNSDSMPKIEGNVSGGKKLVIRRSNLNIGLAFISSLKLFFSFGVARPPLKNCSWSNLCCDGMAKLPTYAEGKMKGGDHEIQAKLRA